jgi:hypothetical protein
MIALISNRSHRLGGAFLAVLACGVAACSGGSAITGNLSDGGTSDGGADGGTGASTPDPSCRASYPVSQPLSAPCCVDRGADACGAGLFCAAFDGRTQPTCYPEHSRLVGETCTADVQCQSSACEASGVCSKLAPDGGCATPGGCGTPADDSGSPHPGMCPPTCATNNDCAASCPSSPKYTQCCDTITSICYANLAPQCPTP